MASLLEQLAGHDEQVRAAQTRAQQLAREGAEHDAELGRLKAERIAAYSADDEAAAKKLRTRAATAATHSTELEERRQGAELAARRVQGERDAFITQNLTGLIAERRPAALEAVRRIEAAIADLSDGIAAWHAVARGSEAFLRVAGYGTRGMPELPVQQLARELERVAANGLPVPLPGAQFATMPRAERDGEDARVEVFE